MIASAIMAIESVSVVTNSLRLKRFQPRIAPLSQADATLAPNEVPAGPPVSQHGLPVLSGK